MTDFNKGSSQIVSASRRRLALKEALRLGLYNVSDGFATIIDLRGRHARRQSEKKCREYLFQRVGSRSIDSSALLSDQMKIASDFRVSMPRILGEATNSRSRTHGETN